MKKIERNVFFYIKLLISEKKSMITHKISFLPVVAKKKKSVYSLIEKIKEIQIRMPQIHETAKKS
jgi:hypothetical protein